MIFNFSTKKIKARSSGENFSTYKSWLKKEKKNLKELKKAHTKDMLGQIASLNKEHKGTKLLENSKGYVVECRNVEKWYANKKTGEYTRVLKNVNLKIRHGELVVILGESGSGKTTLLNILAGMERASNGVTVVFSHSLTTMDQNLLVNFRAKYLSIIFQNYALIPELTVKENILVGQRIQSDVRKRLDVDKIAELLQITGQLTKIPKALSGGQQQRVSIARALAKNPKLIFADEPTGAVDADTCRDILNIFVDINRRFGTTIFLITHNRLIAKIAHKVVTQISFKNTKIIRQKLQQKRTKPHRFIKRKLEEIEKDSLPFIFLKNVNKYFGSFHALKDINLTIDKGEFVSILGPSGSGKTTLINLLSGIDIPTNGQLIIDKHNTSIFSDKELTAFRRKRIFRDIFWADDTTDVSYLLDIFNLLAHENKYPSQLSGGQQQRVSIARSLVKRPSILFADEATGALDHATAKIILQFFRLINIYAKTTIIMITHNPAIATITDRVIRIEEGRIVEDYKNLSPLSVDNLTNL
ncbi:hypothetical protein PVNG_02356 [Plasmodium vivax North Korean]|uniref:ABC transporter domain-containing protein n=1 Tax=Plasmodium vivax North Korean TaxID=1035514 RepID=A0A0J9W6L7_PLAVI|nr:hypothetical protein PVNG_02356 [Plasmodium vivax North Korean]